MKIPVYGGKIGQKRPISNIHFGKVFFAFALVFTMVFSSFNIAEASATKTMTVTIGEGAKDVSNLSKVVNISNLKSIVKITANTGTVTHSINGDDLTLNASGGTPSRLVNNPTKYSKTVSNSLTSDINSFSDTNPYSDSEGYKSSGLYKSGSVITNNIPPHSRNISRMYIDYEFMGWRRTTDQHEWRHIDNRYSYYDYTDAEGYSGSLSMSWEHFYDVEDSDREGAYYKGYGSGTITKPGSKSYTQNYSGMAYKSGVDNYYKYTITIEYIDNSEPILAISLPYENSYFSKDNLV